MNDEDVYVAPASDDVDFAVDTTAAYSVPTNGTVAVTYRFGDEYVPYGNDGANFTASGGYAAPSNDSASFAALTGGLTRTTTVSGDGAVTATRAGTQQSRTATVDGDGVLTVTRTTTASRVSAVSGDGAITFVRAVVKPRTSVVSADGDVTTTRATTKERATDVSGAGEVAVTRQLTKPRVTAVRGDGQITTSRLLTKDRATAVRGDGVVTSRAEFTEVFPEEQTNNLSWDFSFDDPFGFVSEWITETRDINDTEAFTVVVDSNIVRSYRLGVEYDIDGDGEDEHRTEPQHVTRDGQTLVFPSVGDPGQYRLYIQQMRPDDYLRELTVGLTRY